MARDKSHNVDPKPITGSESVGDLINNAFPSFVGRQLREAARLMERTLADDHAVFCTLSGAMTPAGIHQSCIIPLIEAGAINCLTTTGANLYHDAHRLLGDSIFELSPPADDIALRREKIIRIYDLGFEEGALLNADKLFREILKKEKFQRAMTTPQFHHALGEETALLQDERGSSTPSLLATCWRYGVPIFCGAPQDGSLFLAAVALGRRLGKKFRFTLDMAQDVYQMAALQHWCRRAGRGTAIWILGGGVPKNYTLQGEPMLNQFLNVDARGFDVDLQICVDVEDNGALSGCTGSEGHTWGKTSQECARANGVYLRADVTATLPWLTHHVLAQAALRREPLRLYDRLTEAVATLDAETAKQDERQDAKTKTR